MHAYTTRPLCEQTQKKNQNWCYSDDSQLNLCVLPTKCGIFIFLLRGMTRVVCVCQHDFNRAQCNFFF